MSLYQTEVWVANGGRVVPVKDIDQWYARNILRFLESRAAYLKEQYELLLATTAGPSGEMAKDDFDRGFAQTLAMSPRAWLRSTPLYRAIEKRAAA